MVKTKKSSFSTGFFYTWDKDEKVKVKDRMILTYSSQVNALHAAEMILGKDKGECNTIVYVNKYKDDLTLIESWPFLIPNCTRLMEI